MEHISMHALNDIEDHRRTAEVIPRTRARALNSSVVGVAAPVQTVMTVSHAHE